VHRCAIGEHNRRTQGRAGTGIAPGHDRGHVVAAGIEARNGFSIGIEHARIGIGRKPRADGDVGRPDGDRVKRGLRNWAYAGIGLVARIAVEAVERSLAFAEINIDAGSGKFAVFRSSMQL
jgi:hypothetical protein